MTNVVSKETERFNDVLGALIVTYHHAPSAELSGVLLGAGIALAHTSGGTLEEVLTVVRSLWTELEREAQEGP